MPSSTNLKSMLTLPMCVSLQVNPATIFVDSSPFKGAVIDTPELYIKRWGWIGDPRY